MKVDESAGSDEETKPEKRRRLDLDTLLKPFRSKGACGTLMATTCDAQLEDGSKSRLLYIIPKYDLNAAIERRDDMFAAMPLCLARSEAEVEAAAADPETGRTISQCFLSDTGSSVVDYDGRDCR